MQKLVFTDILKENTYPGRGIMIGRSADGTKAVLLTSSWDVLKTPVTEFS